MRAAFLITFATISVTIAQSEVLIMSPESESVVNNESVLVAASLLGVQNYQLWFCEIAFGRDGCDQSGICRLRYDKLSIK